jgi:hypothetical protein
MLRAIDTFSGAKMLPGSPGTCASPLGNDDASGIPSEVFYWAYISSLVGFIPSIAFVVFFLNSFQIVDNCSMGWYQICFLQKHHVTPRHFNHFSAISMSLCFCSKGDVTATAVHYLFRPAQGEVGSRARARARADFLPSSRLLGSSAEAFWLCSAQQRTQGNARRPRGTLWHVACSTSDVDAAHSTPHTAPHTACRGHVPRSSSSEEGGNQVVLLSLSNYELVAHKHYSHSHSMRPWPITGREAGGCWLGWVLFFCPVACYLRLKKHRLRERRRWTCT